MHLDERFVEVGVKGSIFLRPPDTFWVIFSLLQNFDKSKGQIIERH